MHWFPGLTLTMHFLREYNITTSGSFKMQIVLNFSSYQLENLHEGSLQMYRSHGMAHFLMF
jgi:hypothetical protein